MPKVRLKTPIFRILRKSAPHIQGVVGEFVAARALASDGGTRITWNELQNIGVEIGFRIGSVVAEELHGANADVIDADFHDA